jgi:hypothetical protein
MVLEKKKVLKRHKSEKAPLHHPSYDLNINPFRIVKVEDHTKDPTHTKFECFVIGIYFVVFQPS